MSKMGQIVLGIEESKIIIDEILDFLQGTKMNNFPENENKNFIRFFKYLICSIEINWDEIDFVYETLGPIASLIERSAKENSAGHERSSLELEIWENIAMAKKIYYQNRSKFVSRKVTNKFSSKAVNSANYYNQKIEELNIERTKLEGELSKTKGNLTEKSVETLELEKQVGSIKLELEEQKLQLELKKKEEDAKSNWEEKINSTFMSLKEYLKPISVEHRRLKLLWGTYSILSALLVVCIVLFEYNAFQKITSQESFPNFKEYMTLFLPLPIAGGLLWGFIFQMNRAQRQLVVLAKSIHSVEYVQGLLLAINSLSPSIEDAVAKINNALDKLIDNHLSQEDISTESGLVKEENKDSIPMNSVLKILKEAKGFVKK